MMMGVISAVCYYINLFLLPINYHFASTFVLAISLDTVGGAVEVFGVFILFITILSFVSYYRNTFLSVFGSKNGTTVSKNKTKLQILTKSVTHSMTAKAITVKSYFNKFLK